MAEHRSGSRRGVAEWFKEAMSDYGERQRYKDPKSQKALQYYKSHPERSQKTIKRRELGNLERILLDDAQFPDATSSPQWELKKYLGSGGYGLVTMWERYMGPEQDPLRLACKDTEFDTWFKDLCEEANITQILNRLGCVNVVKVIDWRVDPEDRRSRILYEYCPHGTLEGFEKYHDKDQVTMPEAFIWHVFHSLATALCYHTHGTTAEEAIAGWEAIVHRDIKPQNILMADPDLNNRPLYPTIKLADYGLAYTVPDENVRYLKRQAWSGGTPPYAAPEVMWEVRRDPEQAPHDKVYPESDVFSVGCIILEMMRMSLERYHAKSKQAIDFEFPFPYNFFPYSEILRELAMDCIKKDVRSRPRVREVYKRTKYYADLWYGKVSGPGLGKPQEAYAGQVLWNKDLRNRFETNMHFRWNYTIHNDWFYNHTDSVAKLSRTATDPGQANVPRDDEEVAIGNGLGYRKDLAAGLIHPARPEEWPMNVFNRDGNLLRRKDRKKIRRMERPRLGPPKQNENWKENRIKMLEDLIHLFERKKVKTSAERDHQARILKELVAMRHDPSARPTHERLSALKAVGRHPEVRKFAPHLQIAMINFANEMRAYLDSENPIKSK